jgi:cell division protein FtsZ
MNYEPMQPRFSFDDQHSDNATIKVVGVGGGGGNAVNNMIDKGLVQVEYISLNTDAQVLKENKANLTIQVGKSLTQGLGAGARPEIGREAIEENRQEIENAIEGADMVFITAGMGGGTGTGGAPIVSSLAKKKGILTVAIVTTPFVCEGRKRMASALAGIAELKKTCDTVIVIPNERILDIIDKNTSMKVAFDMANQVLYNATKGISDLILLPGFINLDFADVRTTMEDGGAAIMGSATASGEDRAEIAAREAIHSPLLDNVSIRGARNVLVNISAGNDLGMHETTMATDIIQQEAGEDAEIIMGTVLDENMGENLSITVIATGFDLSDKNSKTTFQAAKPVEMNRMPNLNTSSSLNANKGFNPTSNPSNTIASKTVSSPISSDLNTTVNSAGQPFYKGERNLKELDTPAIMRKSGQPIVRDINTNDKSTSNSSSTLNPFARPATNSIGGTIKSRNAEDREKPAFLRRVMD